MLVRDIITHNFWIKFLSMLLATVIWLAIKYGLKADLGAPTTPVLNPVVQKDVIVPVNVLTQPGDARVFKISPENVVVTLTGEDALLRKYLARDFKSAIKAYVDLTEIRTNEAEEVRLDLPDGIARLNMAPRAVSIEQVSP